MATLAPFAAVNEIFGNGAGAGDNGGNGNNDEDWEGLVQEYMHDIHYTTVVEAGVNFVHAMIGPAVVALPFAVSEAGLPLFGMMLIIMAVICNYTSRILVKMAASNDCQTLAELAESAFGLKGFYGASALEFALSFANLCMSLSVFGDVANAVVGAITGSHHAHQRDMIVVIGAVVALPLSCARILPHITKASWVAVAAVATMMLAMLYHTFDAHIRQSGSAEDFLKPRMNFPFAFMIVFVNFGCQHKCFMIYRSIRRRTIGRWDLVVHYSVAVAGLVYALVGYVGFFSLDEASPNYFAEGPKKDTFLTIARIVMGVSVICTYPVDCLVAVNAIRRIMRRYRWQRLQAYRRGRLDDSMHAERATDISSVTIGAPSASEGSIVIAEPSTSVDVHKVETGHYSFRNTSAMMESEVDMRLLREPSIFQVMETKPTLFGRCKELSPIIVIWLLSMVLSTQVNSVLRWIAVAGCSFCIVIIFLLPSALYFRLGVSSDYGEIAICGQVPNRIYMWAVQLLGIAAAITLIPWLTYSFSTAWSYSE